MRLGPKITETVRGKLSLGARILQFGGVEKIFKQLFHVGEDEKLLKASQCYLSTSAGPIAGLLFISTCKIAFCSQKSIKFSSPNGELIRARYKVILERIQVLIPVSLFISPYIYIYKDLFKFSMVFLQVVIPLSKIQRVNQSVNVKKPSQKYIEIVTVDNFDFWFMGFLNHQKALKCLQQSVAHS